MRFPPHTLRATYPLGLPLVGRSAAPTVCGCSMRTGWRGRTAACAGLLAGLGGGTPAERRGRNLPGDSPEAELVADRP